jgi:signal transduction histidine kinase
MLSVLRNKFPRSATLRLTIFYIFLFTVSVFAIFSFIALSANRYLLLEDEGKVDLAVLRFMENLNSVPPAEWPDLAVNTFNKPENDDLVFALFNQKRQFIRGTMDNPPPYPKTTETWRPLEYVKDGVEPGMHERVRAKRILLPSGYELFVGRQDDQRDAVIDVILSQLVGGVLLTVILGMIGGVILTGSVVSRLEVINDVSREIMTGDLTARIPTKGTGDEYDRVADNLNRMLDQINVLMTEVKRVSDNISHDLRTPLTRLRNRLEQLLDDRQDRKTQRAVVERAIEDSNGLLDTFNALLRIAEINSGSRRARFAELDLGGILQDVYELYEPVAAERDQTVALHIPASAIIRGDKDLLFQAITNLVDNAIKHTPGGGPIDISLKANRTEVTVSVADSGPGILPEERNAVFNRFYRTESSRTTPGSGLGLTLVAAIAELHGARIELGDNKPGLLFKLVFPLAPGKPLIG